MALAYATLSTIQVDYGLDENQIARLQVMNTIAGALGCLIGGVFGDRFGARRAVATAYALTAAAAFLLATQISQSGLAAVAPAVFYGTIIAHGFVFGMAYGSRNAIYMSMTNPAVAATQFTAFMGMSNLAVSIGNYWQGIVAERMGYATVLYIDAAIALLVIGIIPFLHARDEVPESKAAATVPAEAAPALAGD
jgi:PAT family beta-lactamase induction signal transducer AmpG